MKGEEGGCLHAKAPMLWRAQKILCAADKEGNQEWVSEQESKQNGAPRNTEIS